MKKFRILQELDDDTVWYYPQVKKLFGWVYIDKQAKVSSFKSGAMLTPVQARKRINSYVSVVLEKKGNPFLPKVFREYTWTSENGLAEDSDVLDEELKGIA